MKQFTAPKNTGLMLLADSSRGVYIPKYWYEGMEPDYWQPIESGDASILQAGPEHDYYWDTWEEIIDNQFCTDTQGRKWTLYQDGDLWLTCDEAMTDDEKTRWLG